MRHNRCLYNHLLLQPLVQQPARAARRVQRLLVRRVRAQHLQKEACGVSSFIPEANRSQISEPY